MKAIIIAGGTGKRLHPLTSYIPKPMIEVSGKPILLHIIELLKRNGIFEIILALCYLPQFIISYFGDGRKFGVKINYTLENPSNPLGTAGAITLAKQSITEDFILTYADILRDLDIRQMVAIHEKNNAFATLNVYKRESKNAKSVVIINDDKRVVKFIERPAENDLLNDYIWVNGSFYIFKPEIFNFIPDNRKTDFGTDIFPLLLRAKKVLYTYPSKGYFVDIGNVEKLKSARKTFKKLKLI